MLRTLDDLPPVTALIAESDNSLLENLRLYASCQRTVELCGAVPGGGLLLGALESGACPDVLVLDALLPDIGIFTLLERLGGMRWERRPAIIVTTVLRSNEMHKKFLTLGADFLMLKPYSLPELFHTVQMVGTDQYTMTGRRINEYASRHLEAMRADFSTKGTWYLLLALRLVVPQEESYTLSEVYCRIAEHEHLSAEAVAPAMRRAIIKMRAADTEEYRSMCEYLGKPGKILSNAEFLARLAQCVRRELNL